jgi:hypothetical protein
VESAATCLFMNKNFQHHGSMTLEKSFSYQYLRMCSKIYEVLASVIVRMACFWDMKLPTSSLVQSIGFLEKHTVSNFRYLLIFKLEFSSKRTKLIVHGVTLHKTVKLNK